MHQQAFEQVKIVRANMKRSSRELLALFNLGVEDIAAGATLETQLRPGRTAK